MFPLLPLLIGGVIGYGIARATGEKLSSCDLPTPPTADPGKPDNPDNPGNPGNPGNRPDVPPGQAKKRNGGDA